MGIDYLNLLHSCDREFGIRLNKDDFVPILEKRMLEKAYSQDSGTDFLVRDFVQFVEESVQSQNPGENRDVYERVKQQLIDCLMLDENEVPPSAWVIRDLGLS